MRTFVKSGKKQTVDGNSITTMPEDWQTGDATDDGYGSPIVHSETIDDPDAYIETLLRVGYTEVTE